MRKTIGFWNRIRFNIIVRLMPTNGGIRRSGRYIIRGWLGHLHMRLTISETSKEDTFTREEMVIRLAHLRYLEDKMGWKIPEPSTSLWESVKDTIGRDII